MSLGRWMKRDVAPERGGAAVMAALDRSQAVIEFTPSGEILNANRNFLGTWPPLESSSLVDL